MKSKFLSTIIFFLISIGAVSANAYEVKLDLTKCKIVKMVEMGSHFAHVWGVDCPGELHYVAVITDYKNYEMCYVLTANPSLYKVVLHTPHINTCTNYSVYRLQPISW